ncbi:unnamed protein product [Haemonchus placei]|uniref:Uncharacterized protein n=1 Tax=Haemonchus placei TaxID=6290 RepID=A0A0N4X3D6_HAEPC|nr:unnamed protein product [Haemonchus placei]
MYSNGINKWSSNRTDWISGNFDVSETFSIILSSCQAVGVLQSQVEKESEKTWISQLEDINLNLVK